MARFALPAKNEEAPELDIDPIILNIMLETPFFKSKWIKIQQILAMIIFSGKNGRVVATLWRKECKRPHFQSKQSCCGISAWRTCTKRESPTLSRSRRHRRWRRPRPSTSYSDSNSSPRSCLRFYNARNFSLNYSTKFKSSSSRCNTYKCYQYSHSP